MVGLVCRAGRAGRVGLVDRVGWVDRVGRHGHVGCVGLVHSMCRKHKKDTQTMSTKNSHESVVVDFGSDMRVRLAVGAVCGLVVDLGSRPVSAPGSEGIGVYSEGR